MEIEQVNVVINQVIEEIQVQNSYKTRSLQDDLRIVKDLGFSSLDVAQLIGSLEMELGVDPFSEGVPITDVHSIGELCQVYRDSLEKRNLKEAS